MIRQFAFIAAILFASLFSACQIDASSSLPLFLAQSTETPTSTPTATPTVTAAPTLTPSPTLTPTPAPSPTPTPIASARLNTAQRAYASGHYELARQEYDALLNDPGASADEQRLALYWRGRSELELGDSSAAIATLRMFVQQYPADSLTQAAQFNLGRALAQSGQLEPAIQAYQDSIVPQDPVNVYIHEIVGDLHLSRGAYTDTISAYRAGINATTDASFQVHLREGIAQALLLSDTPEAALAEYDDILSIARIPSYRAKILRLKGDAYLELDNRPAAHDAYLEAVNNYPEAYDSYLALVQLVNAGVPVDEFRRGLIDYHAEAYQPAIAAFERYLAQLETDLAEPPLAVPTEPITGATTLTATGTLTSAASAPAASPTPALPNIDEALWLLGRSHQALGQYNAAIATFQRLIDTYPASAHWGEAYLEMGKTLISQGSYDRAKVVLRDFAGQAPAHALAPEALWRAARLDMSNEMFEAGYRHMHELIQAYPASQYTGEALYWAGQSAYMLENYEQAIADWTRLAESYPLSDLVTFATYWRGRTLQQVGRDEEARQVLTDLADGPLDYYRLRARDTLANQPLGEAGSFAIPAADQLAREQAEAETWLAGWLGLENSDNLAGLADRVRNDAAFQRGEKLLAFGLRDKALIEFELVKDNWWDDALAMYQLANYFGEQRLGRLSILAAARLIFLSPARAPDDAPIYIQRLYYPVFFEDVLLSEADAQGVEPALLAALIRQESLFEASAESIAGARGLMQVMPATGEYVAQRSNFGGFDTDLLWRPYVSIKFGAWYISQQLSLFEGNQFAAMAAYNAGPGNVSEWLQISNDLDIFVESIPFWESRTYIRKVYVNLEAYRRLYAADS